jgi:glycosyltransferase involved in cell wall biosynthesis
MRTSKRAAIIRSTRWDITQAVPRTAGILASQGFGVTILSWDPAPDQPAAEMRDGVEILRFKRNIPNGTICQFLFWLLWCFWVVKVTSLCRFNVVHVMNLEALIPAIVAKLITGHRIVYDIRDAWGMVTSQMPFPIPQIFTCMDRILSAHADGIVLSQGRLAHCAAYFGPSTSKRVPVVQVLNVPQEDMLRQYSPPAVTPLRLNFSGYISWVRNLSAVIEVCKENQHLQLDVVGEIKDQTIREALRDLDNVTIYGRVPYPHAMALIQKASLVCVMYDTNTIVAQVSSANKMFEAMMMGRPYVASRNGYPADIAERFNVGWSIDYGDQEALERLVDDLLSNPLQIAIAGASGRKVYEEHFQWAAQRKNMVELYAHLLRGHGNSGYLEGWQLFLGSHSC